MRNAVPVLALIALALMAFTLITPAFAAADRMQRSLEELEPVTQMMEVCDMAVSAKISSETRYSLVDRVVADAVNEPVAAADVITANGGAFRDHGHWYGLRYSCTLTPDHLAAKALRYAIGHEIPESQWEQYGLWR
jgi:hypothetical protein